MDCVIGRRSITIRLPPSSLAKLIILTPIVEVIADPQRKVDVAAACGEYVSAADAQPTVAHVDDDFQVRTGHLQTRGIGSNKFTRSEPASRRQRFFALEKDGNVN